jgi:hypothetical protein
MKPTNAVQIVQAVEAVQNVWNELNSYGGSELSPAHGRTRPLDFEKPVSRYFELYL